jgi:hypothetical protein
MGIIINKLSMPKKLSLIKICPICKKKFNPSYLPNKQFTIHCSMKCRGTSMKGKTAWNKGIRYKQISGNKHWKWKGGRYKSSDGYIMILATDHPFCDYAGYVREHRIVVEKILKRYLTKSEKVHHINGIKNDNSPENLYLFTDKEHKIYHSLKNKPIIKSNLI